MLFEYREYISHWLHVLGNHANQSTTIDTNFSLRADPEASDNAGR